MSVWNIHKAAGKVARVLQNAKKVAGEQQVKLGELEPTTPVLIWGQMGRSALWPDLSKVTSSLWGRTQVDNEREGERERGFSFSQEALKDAEFESRWRGKLRRVWMLNVRNSPTFVHYFKCLIATGREYQTRQIYTVSIKIVFALHINASTFQSTRLVQPFN